MEELVRQNRQDMAKIVGMLEKAAKDKDKKIESLQKQLKESGAEADEEVKERQVLTQYKPLFISGFLFD